jgi:MscS family membrane protein
MTSYLEIIIYNQYFQAFLIVLAFYFLAKFISFVSSKYLKTWSQKTSTNLDDLIVDKLKPPFIYIIVLLGLQIALASLETNYEWLTLLVKSIMALFLFYAVMILSDILIEFSVGVYKKRAQSKVIDSLLPLFRKTVRVVLIIFAFIWILSIWGVNIGPLLAGAGIAGFVIGFAMQDTLKNIFGGISMILDKTVQVGDRISLDTGEMGLIEEVSIRSTKIRTFNNELLTLPNGNLADSKITNYTEPNLSLRVVINFSVAYGSDLDQVKKIAEETIAQIKDIAEDPPVSAIMVEMADSGLNWLLRFWVADQGIAFDKKIEALDLLYKALNKAGIEIPFPTRTVYLKKDKDNDQ